MLFESDGQYQVHYIRPKKLTRDEPEYPCIYPMCTFILAFTNPPSLWHHSYAWHRSQPATSHPVRHRSLNETHPARMPRTRFADALGPNTGPLDNPTNAWEGQVRLRFLRSLTWFVVVSSTQLSEDCHPLHKKFHEKQQTTPNLKMKPKKKMTFQRFRTFNHFQILVPIMFHIPAIQNEVHSSSRALPVGSWPQGSNEFGHGIRFHFTPLGVMSTTLTHTCCSIDSFAKIIAQRGCIIHTSVMKSCWREQPTTGRTSVLLIRVSKGPWNLRGILQAFPISNNFKHGVQYHLELSLKENSTKFRLLSSAFKIHDLLQDSLRKNQHNEKKRGNCPPFLRCYTKRYHVLAATVPRRHTPQTKPWIPPAKEAASPDRASFSRCCSLSAASPSKGVFSEGYNI